MNLTTSNQKQEEEQQDLNAGNSNIIFEAGDLRRDIELILFEQDCKRFQLHLWNAMTDKSIIIDLDRHDITKLADAICPFADMETATVIEENDDGLNFN